jgi:hypothetical protein
MAKGLIQCPLSFLKCELSGWSKRLSSLPGNRLLETGKQNELPLHILRYLERVQIVVDAIPRLLPLG